MIYEVISYVDDWGVTCYLGESLNDAKSTFDVEKSRCQSAIADLQNPDGATVRSGKAHWSVVLEEWEDQSSRDEADFSKEKDLAFIDF